MKILLTGVNGQLGNTLKTKFSKFYKKVLLYCPDKKTLDLKNLRQCKNYVESIKPDFLINCAAFTNVEEAEDRCSDAITINAEAPGTFAQILNKNGGHLIHISTDYVFDGKKKLPYKTYDKKNPLCVYGKSKSEGENLIKKNFNNISQYTIIRASWLISPYGKNFVKKIINLLCASNDDKPLKIISDQFGCTTSVYTLSEVICRVINFRNEEHFVPNILHWSDRGMVNWYEIAVNIKELLNELGYKKNLKEIKNISSEEYLCKAKRPKFSLLDINNTEKLFNIKSNLWKDELKIIVRQIYDNINSDNYCK